MVLQAQNPIREICVILANKYSQEKSKAQWILGGKGFVDRISPALREKSELREIPRQERLAFRPPLEEVLSGGMGRSRVERKRAIRLAYLE